MPINLTTPVSISNGTRLAVTRPRVDEDAKILTYSVGLRTANAGSPPDAELASTTLEIRAGSGDRVRRNASPVSGASVQDMLIREPGAVVVANAFDNAFAALKTSRAAFEAHLLAAGYVHSTLTGT